MINPRELTYEELNNLDYSTLSSEEIEDFKLFAKNALRFLALNFPFSPIQSSLTESFISGTPKSLEYNNTFYIIFQQ